MAEKTKEQNGIEYYMQLPYSILLHEVQDDGQKYWIAEVPELPGCQSHGTTIEDAVKSVEEAKKDWISDSLQRGEEIPTPVERDKYSGKILVRMSRSLHHSLALMAEAERLSLNQLMVTILAKEVGRLSVLNRLDGKLDNVLNRINDVLEQHKTRVPSSRLLETIAELCEQQRYVVDTGHFFGVANEQVTLAPAVASTASPLETLWSYAHQPDVGVYRIVYSTKETKEADKIKT